MVKTDKRETASTLFTVVGVLLVVSLVLPFLPQFGFQTGAMGSRVTTNVGIFGDYSRIEAKFDGAAALLTINSIFVLLTALLSLAFIVMVILDCANVEIANAQFIIKIMTIALLICTSIMVLFAVIIAFSFSETASGWGGVFMVRGAIGFFLQFVPLIASGIALIGIYLK